MSFATRDEAKGGKELEVGVSRLDITPPIGVHLQGYLRDKPCSGILDPLTVTALAFRDGEKRALLVSADLIGLPTLMVQRVRKAIGDKTGIPPEAVMFLCSHTHYGPNTGIPIAPLSAPPDPPYLSILGRWLTTVALEASQDLRPCPPVKLGRAIGKLGINRRLPTHEGIAFAPNPDGIVDRRLRLLCLDGIACLVHYTCHPTTMGSQGNAVSADYVGALRSIVERLLGIPMLFVQGCAGQIRPQFTDETGKRFRGATPEEMRKAGFDLGQTAMEALGEAEPLSLTPIAFAHRRLRLPLQDPPSFLEWRQLARHGNRLNRLWARFWLQRVQRGQTIPKTVPLEVQVLRLGDLFLVALSGEPLLELGMAMEEAVRPKTVLPCGYANGCEVGYLCLSDTLKEGGYEASISYKAYSLPAPLKEGGAERVVDVAIDLIYRLGAK